MARKKNWKQKKHEEKVFGFRNWAAKHNKHKGGSHKSKKDYVHLKHFLHVQKQIIVQNKIKQAL